MTRASTERPAGTVLLQQNADVLPLTAQFAIPRFTGALPLFTLLIDNCDGER
jgi:hypothetical protein